jgi:hypothetical protein
MNWTLVGGIAAIILILFALRKLSGKRGRAARQSFVRKDFLLSPEERLFFRALKDATADRYEVFVRVPVEAALAPRGLAGRDAGAEEFEAIAGLPIPFLLCHQADLGIACAVQLQEHGYAGRKSAEPADPLKPICQAAGLPLVRFEANPLYDAREIREAVAAAVRKEPLYVTESDGRKEPRFSGFENLDI